MGIALALTALSIVYQYEQAKKARAAADARKGQFLSVEGEIVKLPLVYGRVRVTGARVYHNTASRYVHVAPESNTDVFLGGRADGSSYTVTKEGENGPEEVTMPASEGTVLDENRDGGNNEFLYVQQALCVGPIYKCHDVLIGDTDTYNKEDYNPGLKIVVHRTGEADGMVVANSPEEDNRDLASFPGAAHASMCFRLNRDNPQYSGVPNVSFLVEGRLVRQISYSAGVYSLGDYAYSNSPPLCLLDYLMDTAHGRGLSVNDIDLKSFYNAHVIRQRTIPSAALAGKIWQTTKPVESGGRSVLTATLPIFEANIALDTGNSIRENVKTLLSTMGDARLIWSGGVYKLMLNYPHSGDSFDDVPVIDDDVLVQESMEIEWPGMGSRKNFCTVRFPNEAKDFKEDTATWPPRHGVVHSAFLSEDSGIPLETDVQANGITTVVHAIAKAEEVVRASRNSVVYSFSTILKNDYYEPGDVVRLNSVGLDMNVLLQLDTVEVGDDSVAKIRAVAFVPSELAWNIDDNAVTANPPELTNTIGVPTNFVFTPASGASGNVLNTIAGRLTWKRPFDSRVVSFKLYVGKAGEFGTAVNSAGEVISTNVQQFNEMGPATEPFFDVPDLSPGYYVFGIRGVTAYGAVSNMVTTSNSTSVTDTALPAPTGFSLERAYFALKLSWSQPTMDTLRYSTTEVYRNTSGVAPTISNNIVSGATKVGTSSGGSFNDISLSKEVTYSYWLVNVSRKGTRSAISSGVSGVPKIDPTDLIGLFNNVITEDHLWGELVDRINLIDMPNIGLMDRVDALFETYGTTLDASTSAAAAAIYRDQAAQFATNASNSSSTASTQQQLATSAATNAGTAASLAGTHAAAANDAADTASTNATAAGNHASTAGGHATTAGTHAATANDAAGTASTNAAAAGNSALTAGNHASTAGGHATTAGTHAGSAATAASNAGAAATQAAGSAAAANVSETNAANSATTATNAASTASQKEVLATAAATTANAASITAINARDAAGASRDAAAGSQLAAAASEAASLSYKNTAGDSATTALGAAGTASTQAGLASTAATTATNKAGEAIDAATAALNYKNDATTSATTATNAASTATSQAGIASSAAIASSGSKDLAASYAADAGVKRDQAASSAVTAAGHASAAAYDFTTLSARLNNAGGTGISLETAMTASASSITGLKAQWSVKLDAGGYVAGVGLSVDSPTAGPSTSSFIVRSDKFAVGSASGGNYIPFGVTTTTTTDAYGNSLPAGVYADNLTITRGNIQKGTIAASFAGVMGGPPNSAGFYVGPGLPDAVVTIAIYGGVSTIGSGKDAYTAPTEFVITMPNGATINGRAATYVVSNLTAGWYYIYYAALSSFTGSVSASWSATVLYR